MRRLTTIYRGLLVLRNEFLHSHFHVETIAGMYERYWVAGRAPDAALA